MSISKTSPSLKHSIAAISLYMSSVIAGVSTYFVYLAISNATIRLIHFIAISSGVVALSLVVYFINSAVSEESGKIQIDSKLTKSIAVFLLYLSSFVAGIYTYPVILLMSNSAVIPVLSAVVASISTITALISAQCLLKSTAYRANDEKQECMCNTHNEKPNDNNVSTKIPERGPTMLGIGVYQTAPASLPKSSNLSPPNSQAPTSPVSTLPNFQAPTSPVSTLPNSQAPTSPVSTPNFYMPPPPPLPEFLLRSNHGLSSQNLSTPGFSPAGPVAKLNSPGGFIEEIKKNNFRLKKIRGNDSNRAGTSQAAHPRKADLYESLKYSIPCRRSAVGSSSSDNMSSASGSSKSTRKSL